MKIPDKLSSRSGYLDLIFQFLEWKLTLFVYLQINKQVFVNKTESLPSDGKIRNCGKLTEL